MYTLRNALGGHVRGMAVRFGFALQIFRYFYQNPIACLRLINAARLWRLVEILIGKNSVNSAAWIYQRFPLDTTAADRPTIFRVADRELESFRLDFPVERNPLVSIVIPVFNQYATTLSCLQAVLKHTNDIPYEVIIADDASSDLTASMAERVSNIRIVRNQKNLGFLRNCNKAVSEARGELIVLLNNDTNPQEGWLQHLLDVLQCNPTCGLIGPKLIFEDGVLQEAGGIVWRDGRGWNYGRGQNPDAPEFNYLKQTDYVSGACMLVRKALWDQVGGFDERYCPAYYEDTDLAFKVREAGFQVIYQPLSRVVHFEGVSHGVDQNSGIKRQQVINQEVFRAKWERTLDVENLPYAESVFTARDRSAKKRTVLYIDHYVPFYDKDAGSRSTFLYVKTMVEMGYRVIFLGANFFPHAPYTETLQSLGVEVLHGERYAKGWKTWLRENAKHIDIIYLHRPHITKDFIRPILRLEDRPKLVYFGHDLHFLRAEREAAIRKDSRFYKESESWKKKELKIFGQVDTVLYPSDIEVEQVRAIAPSVEVDQLPLYLVDSPSDVEYCHSGRADIVFVGGFVHQPNVDAVVWFAENVLPLILQKVPDMRFHIVGSNVPETVAKLASDNVVVHGFLSDENLDELYKRVRLSVVPLRYGAGVKGKVLEAFRVGVPLVTTPVGAEGIPSAQSVMEIAESAEDFANAVIRGYCEPGSIVPQLEARAPYIEKYFSKGVIQAAIRKYF